MISNSMTLSSAIGESIRLLNSDEVIVLYPDSQKRVLEERDSRFIIDIDSISSSSMIYAALETQVPTYTNNIEESFLYSADSDNILKLDIKGLAIVPCIVGGEGSCISAIVLFYNNTESIYRFTHKSIERVYKSFQEIDIVDNVPSYICRSDINDIEIKIERSQQFFSSIIHDIRTPINAVLGFLDLLEESTEDETHHEYIQVATKSAEMVTALVNDVLDFVKIDTGKLELNMHYFSILDEFEEIVKSFYYTSHKKGVHFRVYFDPLIPFLIYSDSHRIKQIINNLISNAIKFTSPEGTVYLDIDYAEDSDTLIIKVKDTGIGMSDNEVERVFKPFMQASKRTTSQYGGTGLGLSISKDLSEALDAKLSVESKKGSGSEFRLDIPCNSIPGTSAALEVPTAIPKIYLINKDKYKDDIYYGYIIKYLERIGVPYDSYPPNSIAGSVIICMSGQYESLDIDESARYIIVEDSLVRGRYKKVSNITIIQRPLLPSKFFKALFETHRATIGSKSADRVSIKRDITILIVDDNSINLKLMKEVLRHHSSNIILAKDGEEAIEISSREKIDIIIIDENMPKLNGSEAIKQIRTTQRGKDMLIYSLTGDSDEMTMVKIKNAGADRVLTKPIKNSELKEAIEAYTK